MAPGMLPHRQVISSNDNRSLKLFSSSTVPRKFRNQYKLLLRAHFLNSRLLFIVVVLLSFLGFAWNSNWARILPRFQVYRQRNNQGRFNFETVSVEQLVKKKHGSPRYVRNMETIHKLVIDDYRQWHQNQRRVWETQSGFNLGVKTLILRGALNNVGYGDIIRAIARSYLTAVLTERLFLMDKKIFKPLSSVLRSPSGFNFTFDLNSSDLMKKEYHESITNVMLYEMSDLSVFLSDIPVTVVDNTAGINCKDFYKAAQVHNLNPRIKDAFNSLPRPHPRCDELVPFIMNTLFRSTVKLRRYVLEAEKQLGHNAGSYISTHARLGVWFGEKGGRFDFDALGLTENTVAKCLARHLVEEAEKRRMTKPFVFFVSTDTPPFRNTVEQEVRRLQPTSRVIYGTWDVVHIRSLKLKKITNDEEQRIMETFADIYFLSKGVSIVHLPSGFAKVARWFAAMTFEDAKEIKATKC